MFLLSQPTWLIVFAAAVLSAALSVLLHFVIHPFWARELSDDTRKTADTVAMRVGVVYSIVIGMMFTNVRFEHVQMIHAIESESSALIRLYHAIERHGGEENREVRQRVIEYIRFIVDEQWPALREARVQPGDRDLMGRDRLEPIWEYVRRMERQTGDANLGRLMDQIEHFKVMRLFDSKGNLLPLFWYIAFFGYLATLMPLYIYPPSLRRCMLISLYGSMVAVVLVGIFILSHPYSVAAGVEPSVFKSLLKGVK